jgi:hypothetical protein
MEAFVAVGGVFRLQEFIVVVEIDHLPLETILALMGLQMDGQDLLILRRTVTPLVHHISEISHPRVAQIAMEIIAQGTGHFGMMIEVVLVAIDATMIVSTNSLYDERYLDQE